MDCQESDLTKFINFISKYEFSKKEVEEINSELLRFLCFYAKKYDVKHIRELRVHVKEYHVQGKRREYEVEALFLTNKEHFHAEKRGWDAVKVVSELMSALRKQVEKQQAH